jgi:Skp family chaperone for outer membrane proteins
MAGAFATAMQAQDTAPIPAQDVAPIPAQDTVTVQAQVQTDVPNRTIAVQSPVLVIDSQRLFSESTLGKRILDDIEKARLELQEKNDRIAEELRTEELNLTQQRDSLSAEEFRALALAFDEKAQRVRGERKEESRALGERLERERLAFLEAIIPILEEIMVEAGAAVVLEQRQTFINVRAVDITNLAIERVALRENDN